MKKRTDSELRSVAALAPLGDNPYQSGTNVRRALHNDGIRWAIDALRDSASRSEALTVYLDINSCARHLESLLNAEEE